MTADEKIDIVTKKKIHDIELRVKKKQRICMFHKCKDDAINSHLLQRNGVLDYLAVEGHVMECSAPSSYPFGNSIIEMRKIGISNAFSHPLFCKKHDTEVFSEIEQNCINIDMYTHNMLLAYRSLCCEIRKKEKGIEVSDQCIEVFKNIAHTDYLKEHIQGLKSGIRDLVRHKRQMEREILKPKKKKAFIFQSVIYQPEKICVSAINSLSSISSLDALMINIFPYKKKMLVSLGYNKMYETDELLSFVDSWKDIDQLAFQKKLSNLVLELETWCVSPSIMDQNKAAYITNYMDDHALTPFIMNGLNFNLFTV